MCRALCGSQVTRQMGDTEFLGATPTPPCLPVRVFPCNTQDTLFKHSVIDLKTGVW